MLVEQNQILEVDGIEFNCQGLDLLVEQELLGSLCSLHLFKFWI
jgi:hypothetical protein